MPLGKLKTNYKGGRNMTPTIKDQLQIETAPGDDFIEFLRFCADRLNKDEPVQAIWLAWKELTAQK